MSDSPEQVHSQLSSILSAHGLVPRDAKLILQPYATHMPRRPEHGRQHFRVGTAERVICHLIAGPGLGDEYRLAQGFYQACPELVCRPLLFQEQAGGPSYLCLEHFDGVSLDEAVRSGRCDASQWLATVQTVLARLQRTERPSTETEFLHEVAGLVAKTEAFDGFSPLDRILIRDLVRPTLLPRAGERPPRVRWSNGDFVGRNILINPKGEIRLIDYEYATLTHFGATDWLRLVHFSVLPQGLNPQTIPDYVQADQPSQKVHFWLHQLAQLLRASPNATARGHIHQVLTHLLEAVAAAGERAAGSAASSLLVDSIVMRKAEADAQLIERTAWAQSLESDLQAAKSSFGQLAKEHSDRTAWSRSLESELQSAKAAFAVLEKKHAERTTWAKAIEAELATAKANFDQLASEHAERTAWSRSLEAELHAAKADFALLEKKHAERTTWAKSLEQDLRFAQSNFAQLAQEHAERTTWARSLEKELQLAQERFVQLTEEHAKRTAWAQALQGELHALAATTPARAELEAQVLALKRESLEQAARLRALEGVRIDAQTRADAHAAEMSRLQLELDHAQLRLDHLFLQIANQRPGVPPNAASHPPGSP